jgi:nucleotide-binding universal stress UspA family protein
MTTPVEIRTILYATDLGDHMRPVFRFAVTLADRFGAKISMLHVSEAFSADVRWAIRTYMPEASVRKFEQEGIKELQEKMRARLAAFCQSELGQSPEESNLVSHIDVIAGRPAETIVKVAEDRQVDLIVIGTHTGHSLGATLLGSTARSVTHLSRRPVLVVPVFA